MKTFARIGFSFALVVSSFGSLESYAAENFKFSPKGLSGSAGAGVVLFTVSKPAQNFRLDQGIYAAVAGEKGLGAHLYVNLSLAYLSTTGQTTYDYRTLSGNAYTGTDVRFKSDVFQGGLGLKLKLLDGVWFRPYVEGGGLAGYYKIGYTDISSKVVGSGSDYRREDALLDFGYYYEGGLELAFTPQFGLRIGARFTTNQTKEFETLGRSRIDYKSEIYYLNLLAQF